MNKKIAYYILVLLLFLLILFVPFYNLFKYDYLVPPGDDSLRHMTLAQQIVENQMTSKQTADVSLGGALNDVPLMHVLIAVVSILTKVSVVTVTQYLLRFFVGFIGLIILFLSKKIFNSNLIAIFSLLLYTFFSPQPGMIYVEGTYNDIYSASILLPMCLLFFSSAFLIENKSRRDLIIAYLFSIAIMVSHPLTAIGLILIISAFTFLTIILKIFNNNIFSLNRLIWFDIFLCLPAIIISWPYYFQGVFYKIWGLLKYLFIYKNVNQANEALGYMRQGFTQLPTYDTYIFFIGIIIFLFGIIGFFLIFRSEIKKEYKILLMLWIIIFFIASRLSAIQLPVRFARLLYLPLIILAGYCFYYFFKKIKYFNNTLYLIAIVLFTLIIIHQIPSTLNNAQPYISYVRLQNVDAKAVDWINKNTAKNDVFLGTPMVASWWGSFIGLVSNRHVIDCSIDGSDCDAIYKPNSKKSIDFYKQQNISYVYVGKPYIGEHPDKKYINWFYYDSLEQANFLEPVFNASEQDNRIIIYKVNKKLLNNL